MILELVCHRLPERSLWYADQQSLFCSRCTGLYLGVLLTAAVCLAMKTATRYVKPSPTLRATALLLILIICIDVAMGTWRLSAGSNPVRLATGFGGGCALALILVPPVVTPLSLASYTRIRRVAAVLLIATVLAVAILALSASPRGVATDYFAATGLVTYVISVWLFVFRLVRERPMSIREPLRRSCTASLWKKRV